MRRKEQKIRPVTGSLVVLLLLVGAASAAARAGVADPGAAPADTTEILTVSGQTRPGEPAPWLAGWTLDGKVLNLEMALADSTVGPVALVFWATWCAPCRAGLDMLDAAAPDLAAAGVTVLLVSVGEDETTVNRFLADRPTRHRVVLDRFGQSSADWLADAQGGYRLPRTVVVGADGKVAVILGSEGSDYVERILRAW